jgi:hypothetical protein
VQKLGHGLQLSLANSLAATASAIHQKAPSVVMYSFAVPRLD